MQVWLIQERTRDEGLREFYFEGTKDELLSGLETHCRQCVGGCDGNKTVCVNALAHTVFATSSTTDTDYAPWEMQLFAQDVTALPLFYKYTDE